MSGTRIAASSPASQFRRTVASRIVRKEPPCFGVDSLPPSRYSTRYVVPPSRRERRTIQALGMDWADAVVAVGVLLDQLGVLLGADHRSRVSRERNDREGTEDGVDGCRSRPSSRRSDRVRSAPCVSSSSAAAGRVTPLAVCFTSRAGSRLG